MYVDDNGEGAEIVSEEDGDTAEIAENDEAAPIDDEVNDTIDRRGDAIDKVPSAPMEVLDKITGELDTEITVSVELDKAGFEYSVESEAETEGATAPIESVDNTTDGLVTDEIVLDTKVEAFLDDLIVPMAEMD